MAAKNFDNKFTKITTEMTEIAFEFVNYNKQEIDAIYIYGCLEMDWFMYNVFYRVNGQLTKIHKLNNISKKQYDLSDERSFGLLALGNKYLQEVKKLFVEDEREAPTQIKIIYFPKTGKFSTGISYDTHWSSTTNLLPSNIFEQWYSEIESDNKN